MSEGQSPTIDVVIVNYRTGSLVVACLGSLAAERASGNELRAVVVDNASGDDSARMIEAAIDQFGWDWVTLIRSETNGGFGAGNNIGIEHALQHEAPGGFVWLLNPDTRVMPGTVRALAGFMAERPRAGIVGTALLEDDGTPWPIAFRFPTILGEIERGARWSVTSKLLARHAISRKMGNRSEPVDWVPGASLAIRREILDDGIRFDEGYFLYFEETDFCREARARGWETWYAPEAVVVHISGQSTGVTAKNTRLSRMPGYWFESRQRYFRKNHGRLYAIGADLGWMTAHLMFRAKKVFRKPAFNDPPKLLLDFVRHAAFLPGRGGARRDQGAAARGG